MNLILIGPPGAGKGTQAENIMRDTGVIEISTGEIIRDAIAKQTPLGKAFQANIDNGTLVDDNLINHVVAERLSEPDCKKGFMLDGYPRTVAQAEWFDANLAKGGRRIRRVLLFEVADEAILERITGRRQDPVTHHIYHLTFDPPPPEIAARVIHRHDDTAELVVRRLQEYHVKTAPLIPYYEKRGVLARIDGSGTVEEVHQRVRKALNLKMRTP